MIYNENGIIVLPNYNLDELLSESFEDVVNKGLKTVTTIIRKIMDTISSAIDKFRMTKYKKIINIINKNNKEFNNAVEFYYQHNSKLDQITNSKGYSDGPNCFKNACQLLKQNNDLTLEELQKILYPNSDKDKWFANHVSDSRNIKSSSYYINYITTFLNENTECMNELRKAYSEIKIINSVIKNKPIKAEVISELHSYLVHTIRDTRTFANEISKIIKRFKYNLFQHYEVEEADEEYDILDDYVEEFIINAEEE